MSGYLPWALVTMIGVKNKIASLLCLGSKEKGNICDRLCQYASWNLFHFSSNTKYSNENL